MKHPITEEEMAWEAKRARRDNLIAFSLTIFLAILAAVCFIAPIPLL